ncbi:MAG: nucleotide sugar dehydrogenase, partial [Campylobacterota bacterium]|nr:nucleotide sugar dehydrogenase [Campylobacterota bacterium]
MKNKLAIIGLGYVGIPMAYAFSKKYDVIGYTRSKKHRLELQNGYDKTNELSSKKLKNAIKNGLQFTNKIKKLKDCNIYIVCVPTPIDKNYKPNLSHLIEASKNIGKVLKKNDIIIYESTVYPGATEEVCVPELEKSSKLKYNKDFFCGYSPERINPSDTKHTFTKILKVTSGSNLKTAKKVDKLYRCVVKAGTYMAPSIKVAEASKVIENTQRDINIAFMNELSKIFEKIDIDTYEVLKAASTKWNFLNFQPGLVGGHCIGVDPYYLTEKSQNLGYTPQLILKAREINESMGMFIAMKTIELMKNIG